MMRALALLLGCSLVACELPTDPDSGELRPGLDGGAGFGPGPATSACDPNDPAFQDSDPSVDATWADVRELVLTKRCGCHTTAGGIGQVIGGLVLSSREDTLAGGFRSGDQAVIPGDPCGSILVQKIGDTPPFGGKMPLSGLELTTAQRQLLIDWIAEGALP